MLLEKSKDEQMDIFMNNLVSTNRGYNYYVDWSNITGYDEFSIEIQAIDVLIGRQNDDDVIFQKIRNYFIFSFLFFPQIVHSFPARLRYVETHPGAF